MKEYVIFRPNEPSERAATFSVHEWRQLGALYGAVALLHILGGGLYLHFAASHPTLLVLGLVAYLLGLRHAFDADHIAAIDDTVRFMLQKNKKPLDAGFFFALGHSTIVTSLAIGMALAASVIKRDLPQLQHLGGIVGTGVSSLFLLVIGFLNLLVLLDMLKLWQRVQMGHHSHTHLDALLNKRGVLNRLFGGRFQEFMTHGWQMYPLGLLFGLGFDTASEVGMLTLTAGAAAGDMPILAVLSLPLLFAAGITLADTTDGVLMSKAYKWAFLNPARKIYYNITITGFSVGVALLIGTVELLQVLTNTLHLHGGKWDIIKSLDIGQFGYVIAALFLSAWGASVALWKWGHFDAGHASDSSTPPTTAGEGMGGSALQRIQCAQSRMTTTSD